MPAVPGTPIAADSPIDPASCWQTPFDLKERIRIGPLHGVIELDPCTTKKNPVGARCIYTPETDGLASSWRTVATPNGHVHPATIFVNPPFIDAAKWANKAFATAQLSHAPAIVFLGPAAIGTRWWHDLAAVADDVLLLSKRIRYEGVCVHKWTGLDGKSVSCSLDEDAAEHTDAAHALFHRMKIGSPTRGTALFAFNTTFETMDDLGTRFSVRR